MISIPKELNNKVSGAFQKRRFHYVEYTSASQNSCNEVLLTECVIVYILKGRKEITIDGNTSTIVAGQLFLLPKGTYVMSEYLPDEGVFKSLMLFFNQHQIADIFNTVCQESMPSCKEPYKKRIQILDASPRVQNFYQSLDGVEWDAVGGFGREMLDIKIKELIYMLLSEVAAKSSTVQFLRMVCSGTKKPLSLMVRENIYGKVSLGALAARYHMSISTFKREFAREFNASPIQWINEKRLEKSLLLIRNTNIPIMDIAYECGFEGYVHFARRFRAKYGKPANYFRANRT